VHVEFVGQLQSASYNIRHGSGRALHRRNGQYRADQTFTGSKNEDEFSNSPSDRWDCDLQRVILYLCQLLFWRFDLGIAISASL
jgi:hypothetical protein